MGWTEPAALAALWVNMGMLVMLDGFLADWVALEIEALNLMVEALDDVERDDPTAYLRVAGPAAEITVARDALCLLHERLVAPMTWRTWCAVLAGPIVPVLGLARALRLNAKAQLAGRRVAALLGAA